SIEGPGPRRSAVPGGADQRLQGIEMCPQSLPALRAERVPGDRPAIAELLADAEIPGVLQLPQLSSEAPVGLLEQLLEAREGNLVIAGKQHGDSQANTVLEDPVQSRKLVITHRMERRAWDGPGSGPRRPATPPS